MSLSGDSGDSVSIVGPQEKVFGEGASISGLGESGSCGA